MPLPDTLPLIGITWADALFMLLGGVAVAGSLGVVLGRDIIRNGLLLILTLGALAGIYVMLGAAILAGAQVLVYIGAISVLILFAIMLTHQISEVEVSNRAVGRWPALGLVGFVGIAMAVALARAPWKLAGEVATKAAGEGTTYGIGDGFLGPFLLPFELASIVLLTALVGAIVLSRKEIRD